MTTIHLQVAPRVGPEMPRGAELAAALAVAVMQGWRSLRHALQAPGAGAAHDAPAVRETAWRMLDADPRLAADLLAAADRHEQMRGLRTN
jgi:hypothetical protein